METGTFYCKLKVLLIGKCFCSLLHGLKCIQSLKFLILEKCCNNKIKGPKPVWRKYWRWRKRLQGVWGKQWCSRDRDKDHTFRSNKFPFARCNSFPLPWVQREDLFSWFLSTNAIIGMQFVITSSFLFLKKGKCKVTGFYRFYSVDLLSEIDDEVLLIDLRSPDKNMQINFQHLTENSCNSQVTR